jgi:hypothetical protein
MLFCIVNIYNWWLKKYQGFRRMLIENKSVCIATRKRSAVDHDLSDGPGQRRLYNYAARRHRKIAGEAHVKGSVTLKAKNI